MSVRYDVDVEQQQKKNHLILNSENGKRESLQRYNCILLLILVITLSTPIPVDHLTIIRVYPADHNLLYLIHYVIVRNIVQTYHFFFFFSILMVFDICLFSRPTQFSHIL